MILQGPKSDSAIKKQVAEQRCNHKARPKEQLQGLLTSRTTYERKARWYNVSCWNDAVRLGGDKLN